MSELSYRSLTQVQDAPGFPSLQYPFFNALQRKLFFNLSLKDTAGIFSFVLNCDFIIHVVFLEEHFSSNTGQESEMK